MASNRRLAPFLVLVAGLMSNTEAVAQAVDFAGCYQLQLGPWRPSDVPFIRSRAYQVPERIQLDTARFVVNGTEYGFSLRAMDGEDSGVYALSYWQDHEDALHLVWSTGHEAVVVWLHVDQGSIQGHARAWIDHTAPDVRRTVRAISIPCDAPSQDQVRTTTSGTLSAEWTGPAAGPTASNNATPSRFVAFGASRALLRAEAGGQPGQVAGAPNRSACVANGAPVVNTETLCAVDGQSPVQPFWRDSSRTRQSWRSGIRSKWRRLPVTSSRLW